MKLRAANGYLLDQFPHESSNRRDDAYGGSLGNRTRLVGEVVAALKAAFDGAYMANNGYDRDMAMRAVEDGDADLVCFGVPYIANPDLAERLERDAPLNEPRPDLFTSAVPVADAALAEVRESRSSWTAPVWTGPIRIG